MDIKYRLYPYPVLAEFNDSYLNAEFKVKAEILRDGFDLLINVNALLTDSKLQELISCGKATFLYHVECSRTGYREIFETDCNEYKIIIKGTKISGELHFCPFIVAKETLTNYQSINFNPYYSSPIPKIEKGGLLAIGKQHNWQIQKSIHDLLNSSSPFRILKNMDSSQYHMVIEYASEERIKIKLNEKDFALFRSMSNDSKLHDILNSAIVFPALLYVLSELQKMDSESIESNFGNLSWFKSIQEVLNKNFNKNIFMINNEDIYELAQKMLKTPINNALENLANLGCNNNEEEDK